MTEDPGYIRLREASWRRQLTASEQAELRAWLKQHPEAQEEWGAEAGLSDALGELPDVPVASNFTARVLQAVEREESAVGRWKAPTTSRWEGWWHWVPRAALGTLLLGAGLFAFHQLSEFQARAARSREVALSVAAVAEVKVLPGPDILKDYEAIRVLDQTPAADEELLALLQ